MKNLIGIKDNHLVLRNLSANYVLTTGLEIYGYGGTRARRRLQDQKPLIEKYLWLPYMDTNALDIDMKRLSDSYVRLIDDMIEIKSKEVFEDKWTDIRHLIAINGVPDDCLVIKDITECLLASDADEDVKCDEQTLWSDLLNNLYFDESLVRPAIDIVLENNDSFSNKFNVLEISDNNGLCFDRLIGYLKDSFYNLNIKYSVHNCGLDNNDKSPG